MADKVVEEICVGCDKQAKLKCPTCIKLNLPNSYFCSQVFSC